MNNPPTSLSELITYFNLQSKPSELNKKKSETKNYSLTFTIYEMGRGIKKIDKKLFRDFEQTKVAWPYPFLRSAWFALFFSPKQDKNEKNDENGHIWFLKFPLDELGKLVQASSDDFIEQFYKQIQAQIDNGTDSSDPYTTDSPYGFKPSQEKMANINAIIKHQQNILPSIHYQDVLSYIYYPQNNQEPISADSPHWQQWEKIAYQGLADLSCHMHNIFKEKPIEQQLADSLAFFPIPMLKALSSCLEHHQLTQALVSSLLTLAKETMAKKTNHIETSIACLRSISASDQQASNELIKLTLATADKSNIELLAVICGRCFENLKQPWLMLLFLEALALTHNNSSSNKPSQASAFNIMVSDLLFIPGMREAVLEQFRNPERSTQLTLAIGNFYANKGLA